MMNIDNSGRSNYLELSSFLTGYSVVELEGTGLAEEYWKLMQNEINPEILDWLFHTFQAIVDIEDKDARDHALQVNLMASPTLWPFCEAIIMLWYRGQWTSMPAVWYKYYAKIPIPAKVVPGKTMVPSAQAYIQQLVYQGAGAHPPGAKPTGFGSWGLDPVFGDFVPSKEEIS